MIITYIHFYYKFILNDFSYTSISNFRKQVEKISKVTISDLERVAEEYLSPLINANSSTTIIVCNPSVIEETVEFLDEK